MQKILVLEDEASLAKNLVNIFKDKNYDVDHASCLSRAFELVEQKNYDLAMLDRTLPDGDSENLIKYLKEKCFFTRILVLSWKNQVKDKINGLEWGADDYLGKPFSYSELFLRVDKLINKEKIPKKSCLVMENLTLHTQSGYLSIGEEKITLRSKEAALLACLMRFKNQVVSRESLINYVWFNSPNFPDLNTVDVYIRRLRQKMGCCSTMIKTARGFGYLIAS